MRPKWNPRDVAGLKMWMVPGEKTRTRSYLRWVRRVRSKLGGWAAEEGKRA